MSNPKLTEEEKVYALQKMIDQSKHIVFFGGAGVSTESGIPDFRSAHGIYSEKYDGCLEPEMIISHTFFFTDPKEFYKFYREKMLCPALNAEPNRAHLFLTELEKAGKLSYVVTQNIDGLHQKAGTKRVIELHGSVHRNLCLNCKNEVSGEYIRDCGEEIPHCELCGDVLKPDVVLYEEALNEYDISNAINSIQNADLLIVAGTSLKVYPAASFIDYFQPTKPEKYHGRNLDSVMEQSQEDLSDETKRKRLIDDFVQGHNMVLINLDQNSSNGKANLVIHEKVGELFGRLHA